MSKTNKYELLTIFSLKDSVDVKTLKDEVTQILSNNKFEIYKDNELGKRTLAYPIRKETEGYYWVPIISSSENSSIDNLLILLKRKQYILRTMILKYDEEKLKRLKEKEEKYKKAKFDARKRKMERYNSQYSQSDNSDSTDARKNPESENN